MNEHDRDLIIDMINLIDRIQDREKRVQALGTMTILVKIINEGIK